MEEKQSNLAVAVDVESQAELLSLADRLGPHVCMIKTHVDALADFTPDFGQRLQEIAARHQFLIFEDRKFADIGNTVVAQYARGLYHIAEWADLINAHALPGPGIIEGLREIGLERGSGLLLIAEMSSQGTLARGAYAKKTVAMAQKYPEFVIGFICQKQLTTEPGMIHCTPGVQLRRGKDRLGQRYNTVEDAVSRRRSDVIIVGRDIVRAQAPEAQAALYRERAWAAYLHRLQE
jgi:uridine monophosphate synthetase